MILNVSIWLRANVHYGANVDNPLPFFLIKYHSMTDNDSKDTEPHVFQEIIYN
jgi:hypothetical protein